MFLFMPLRIQDGNESKRAPTANSLFIAANVIAFFAGVHLPVGPGTGFLSLFGYAFSHASLTHLMVNMWLLWIVGNSVNRRVGNLNYVLGYLGIVIVIGSLARFTIGTLMAGSSGVIFGMIAALAMLQPSARAEVGYVVVFPITLLLGLFKRPREWIYWLIRWDRVCFPAWNFLFLIPALQVFGIAWWGWNWTNLGHLLGFFCGVAFVLLLPTRVSMPNRKFSFRTYPTH